MAPEHNPTEVPPDPDTGKPIPDPDVPPPRRTEPEFPAFPTEIPPERPTPTEPEEIPVPRA